MAIIVLRPNSVSQDPGSSRVNPDPATPDRTTALYTNLTDGADDKSTNVDTTSDELDESAYDYSRATILGFENLSGVPAGAKIKQVRLTVRSKDRSSSWWDSQGRFYLRAPSAFAAVFTTWGLKSFSNYVGPWQTAQSNGAEWTAAAVDAALVELQAWTDNFGAGVDVSEIWLEAEYNEKPTVTVTAPAEASTIGTTNPTYTVLFADPEGDPPYNYHLKVFTSAQYGAGGFDPETSAAYWDSGLTVSWPSNPLSVVSPVSLPNGTYRIYAKASQGYLPGIFHYSSWDYNQFTVSVTPPPTPTCSAVHVAANYRNEITFGQGGSSPATDFFVIEYSDDAGTTWNTLRYAEGFANFMAPGTWTVYDYEAPPNATRRYRVYAVRVLSGLDIASAYSTAVNVARPTLPTRPLLIDVADAPQAFDTWSSLVETDPITPVVLRIQEEAFAYSSEEPTVMQPVLGRKNPVVISGEIQGEQFGRVLVFATDTAYKLWDRLRRTQRVLLLINDEDERMWVKMIGARQVSEDRTNLNAGDRWRTVTVAFVEQDEPNYVRADG